MNFLTVKNARIFGGGSAAALALTSVIPASGQRFQLPGFTGKAFWNFWLPALVAVAAFMPGTIPNGRFIAGAGLLAIGGRRVIVGQFSPNVNNVAFTYVPIATGFKLAA